MLFAVLFFELEAENTVRQIWQALADNKIATNGINQDISPHITLGMFRENLPYTFSQRIQSFAENLHPLHINMPNFGIFTAPHQVIFLGVTMTDALYNLHRTLYQQFASYLDLSTLFVPATYVPHCTLAYGVQPEKLPTALHICQQFTLPINTYATRIALVEPGKRPVENQFLRHKNNS